MYRMATILMFIALCMPGAMAQKQGKVEKLLKYLNEDDIEKLEKNREKLDPETADAFASEIGLIDVMYQIWVQNNPQAASSYYLFYQQSMEGALPAICAKEKIDISTLRFKTDRVILEMMNTSKDKLSFSKMLIDNINRTKYPLSPSQMKDIYTAREQALIDDLTKKPNTQKCEVYLKEFPDGKNKAKVVSEYNKQLFQALKKTPTSNSFKKYFENNTLNTLAGGIDKRPFINEARSLYDDYMYKLVIKANALQSMKDCIQDYKTSRYLENSDRKYLGVLEYKIDSIDYELLKVEVNSASKLNLIKEYLTTHKYKEFRDKANRLRDPFEEQIIWSNPTSMRFYGKGVLLKSNEVDKNKTVTTTYNYNDVGKMGNIETSIEEKGRGTTLLQTNFFYDQQGHCALEIQINPKTKKEIYKRTRTFVPTTGKILTDSLVYTDGRLIVRSYDDRNNIIEEKSYQKGVLQSSINNQYNEKGWKIKAKYLFPIPEKPLPNQPSSQTDEYEYDKYGYLTKLSFEKVLVNNEKTTGSLIYLYDEYGNQIDSNAYYEYDQTGRWIRKTDRNNPEEVERFQCNYK